jgi:hypothetical protein
MSAEDQPNKWDDDPLTQYISEKIATMPDRPKVAVVLLNQNAELDAQIIHRLAELKEAYFHREAVKVFGLSFSYWILTVYSDTELNLCRFLEVVSTLPIDEGAVYVDGIARMRLGPLKQQPPVENLG